MKKIRIGGIKVSGELVLLNVSGSAEFGHLEDDLFEHLAESRINIHFLSEAGMNGSLAASCCVAAGVMERVKTFLDLNPALKSRTQVVPHVGMLSLFPHQFSFQILGRCLATMLEADIPVFGMNSSLSALTFITDYGRLEEAMETFRRFLDFPRPAGRPCP